MTDEMVCVRNGVMTGGRMRGCPPIMASKAQEKGKGGRIRRRGIVGGMIVGWVSRDWSLIGLAVEADRFEPKWEDLKCGFCESVILRFVKLESGVRIQELEKGKGNAAKRGDRVEIDYVLRRSNGYFIYACAHSTTLQSLIHVL